MKKAYKYLTLCVLAVLSIACSKNEPVVDEFDGGEYKIGFGNPSTKVAVLEPDDDAPLQISVYDLFTSEGSEVVYIEDELQKSTDADAAAWAFVSGKEYAWKKGSHKFFGWVSTDEGGNVVPNLRYSEKVLSVGSESAPVAAVDYRYSEVVTVGWPNDDMIETAADGKKTAKPVELTVKHLTAALTYSVSETEDAVTINSVAVNNIVTAGSATVDYSGNAADVDYSLSETKGSVNLAADTFNCVWPQEVEGAKVSVSYTLNGNNYDAEIDIPDTEWEAGLFYKFTFEVVNKNLTLTFTVLPWDLVDQTLDTKDGSINMSNVTWMNSKVGVNGVERNTVDIPGYTVNMFYHPTVNDVTYTANNGYFPAQGFFTVNYPVAGKFFIGLMPAVKSVSTPDPEAVFDANMYEIWIYDNTTKAFRKIKEDGEVITRTTVYFQVRAAADQDRALHKAQINIWFIPAGSTEKISAYSEIRANYALVIPATN